MNNEKNGRFKEAKKFDIIFRSSDPMDTEFTGNFYFVFNSSLKNFAEKTCMLPNGILSQVSLKVSNVLI